MRNDDYFSYVVRNMPAVYNVIGMMKKPVIETNINVLRAHALCGDDIQTILNLIEQNRVSGVPFKTDDLMKVFYDLCVGGFWNSAAKLLNVTPQVCLSMSTLIPRLVNRNQDDIAFKIVQLISQNSPIITQQQITEPGEIFLKQLVCADRSAEHIVARCQMLLDNQIKSNAFQSAMRLVTEYGTLKQILDIMRCLKSKSIIPTINDFQFIEKQKSQQQVLDTVSAMCFEFNIEPTLDFMRNCVNTNLQLRHPEEMVRSLMAAGVPLAMAVSSVTSHMLAKYELKAAADLICYFNKTMEPDRFMELLIPAVQKTKDLQSYTKFLGCLWRNHSVTRIWKEPKMSNNNNNNPAPDSLSPAVDVFGSIAYQTLDAFPPSERDEVLLKLITGFLQEKIMIHETHAEQIRSLLELKPNHSLWPLLNRITSTSFRNDMGTQKKRLGNDSNSEIKLLEKYYLKRDFNRFQQLLSKLETLNIEPQKLYGNLIEWSAKSGDVDLAMNLIEKAKQLDPSFTVRTKPVMNIVGTFIERTEIAAAVTFLGSEKRRLDTATQMVPKRLQTGFSKLTADGDAKSIETIIQSVLDKNLLKPNGTLLSPLILVHLKKNDLPEAMKAFEDVCAKYAIAPSSQKLSRKLVQNEDWTNLERVFNFTAKIKGRTYSLVELAFTLIACDHSERAQKIFNLNELNEMQSFVNNYSEKFVNNATAEECECFLKAAKDLHFINKLVVFEKLLNHYIALDIPIKAMLLYDRAVDEHLNLDHKFLNKLGNYLKSKMIDVPFNMPEKQSRKVKQVQLLVKLKKLLLTDDIQSIMKFYRYLQSTMAISIDLYNSLIRKFMRFNAMNEAEEILVDMLNFRLIPSKIIFQKFLGRNAYVGNIEAFNNVDKLITYSLKERIGYHSRLISAYIMSGNCEILLHRWSELLENAQNDSLLQQFQTRLDVRAICGMLYVNSNIMQNCNYNFLLLLLYSNILLSFFFILVWTFAVKCASRNVLSPMNAIWCHYVIQGNVAASERIWTEYLSELETICVQPILTVARKRADDKLVSQLITLLKNQQNRQPVICDAYRFLIDIYCDKGNFDQAKNAFHNLLLDVRKDDINPHCLKRINDQLNKLQSSV